MALPNTNISVAMVKAELGAATNNVGQLCIHPNINMWSTYKPISLPSPILNDATRNTAHGFKLVSQKLEYDKPTGTANSPYRLGDFRGYDKNARKPSNGEGEQNFFTVESGGNSGPSDRTVVITIPLPNTELIKRLIASYSIQYCSIYKAGTSNRIGQVNIASMNVSESNRFVKIPTLVDLQYTRPGQTYTDTFDIWYESDSQPRYFQIEGGSKATVKCKVLQRGVVLSSRIVPTDSFIPFTIDSDLSTATLSGGTLSINYIKISGKGKNAMDSGRNFTMYSNFNSKTNWELRYSVIEANGDVRYKDVIVPNWSSVSATSTQPSNLNYGTYGSFNIVTNTPIVVTGMSDGCEVTFSLTFTKPNW